MKNVLRLNLMVLFLAVGSSDLLAQVNGDPDTMAIRGNGVVTHEMFEARAHRIPKDRRFQVLRDRKRMEDILNTMLRNSQLAADARAAGFEQETIVQSRMALAAEEELAKAWLDHYVDEASPADYSVMAREEWTLNKDRYRTSATVDVTHILIGTENRSKQEALTMAQNLRTELVNAPETFDSLVLEYSDDPSAGSNKGAFKGIERGDMVPAFEEQAFNMNINDISEPVLTQYGYHLIRLDASAPARQKSFEEMQLQLQERMRKRHRERVQTEYLQEIYAPEVVVTEESLETMVERVFGKEVMSKYTGTAESE